MNICKRCIHRYYIGNGNHKCGNFKCKYNGIGVLDNREIKTCKYYCEEKGFYRRFDVNG